MTEAEWRADNDPWRMLRAVRRVQSSRKLRLTLCALCRQSWSLFERESGCRAIELAESLADGSATRKELRAARHTARLALVDGMGWREEDVEFMLDRFEGFHFEEDPAWVHRMAVQSVAARAVGENISVQHVTQALRAVASTLEGASDAEDCAVIRDIFGNPFRPIAFEAAWRTSDVMLLAQGIYDDRAFDRIPILADALQDAGCDSADILTHCRDESVKHVRGCWVVDRVLGKE